jgi:hypothetical protein
MAGRWKSGNQRRNTLAVKFVTKKKEEILLPSSRPTKEDVV